MTTSIDVDRRACGCRVVHGDLVVACSDAHAGPKPQCYGHSLNAAKVQQVGVAAWWCRRCGSMGTGVPDGLSWALPEFAILDGRVTRALVLSGARSRALEEGG